MEQKEIAKKVIDLSKVTFKPTIAGQEVTVDMHKEIAESIYQNASGVAAHSFALKLYESDGKIEASEEEIAFIKNEIKNFRYFAQIGVLKALGEKVEEENK